MGFDWERRSGWRSQFVYLTLLLLVNLDTAAAQGLLCSVVVHDPIGIPDLDAEGVCCTVIGPESEAVAAFTVDRACTLELGCTARNDQAPENLAVLRHIALNLLKQEKTAKGGIHAKQLQAAWNDDYCSRCLPQDLRCACPAFHEGHMLYLHETAMVSNVQEGATHDTCKSYPEL